MKTLLVGLALACACPAAAGAAVPWPPAEGPGVLFVHFGEEHWNDDDGLTILPKVVEDSARYRPALVTMSGDKANDGNVDELTRWREIMASYDRAGVPYFAGVGNHDRKSPPGAPGGTTPFGDISNYREVFKDRPYPMGDGPQYADPQIGPRERPANDPPGASSHYFVDYGPVRWIFIDNSCFGIINCDEIQAPSGQNASGDPQYDFMRRAAGEAGDAGRHVFVVMHMPTRDPGDQEYREPTAFNHVMGKGISPDNADFEEVAKEVGVDAVFIAHIKGQFQYRDDAGIPYYIDGGAGGELYTEGPVGVDHGYWHGYRLIRVDGDRISTDTVPIFVPDSLRIDGPDSVERGARASFAGFGRQPVFNDPAKVEALELRDPDPKPRSGGGGGGALALVQWGGPIVLLALFGLGAAAREAPRVRRLALPAVAALALAAGGAVIAVAQQEEPTSTKRENLPTPARIWTSSNPLVLAPVSAGALDDPRRNRRTQTDSGEFRGRCPGRATLELASGWESRSKQLTVPSRPGPIVRSIKRGARVVKRGRSTRVATVRLAQPAQVVATARRSGKRVATLLRACRRSASVRWRGRLKRGRYTVRVQVRSDRGSKSRSFAVRVR